MNASGRSFLAAALLLFYSVAGADEHDAESGFDGRFDLGGGTSLTLGGFFRGDLIHDFDAIGSEDSFDPSTIPTDGSDGSNTRLHAKWTRLNLDLRRPSKYGEARVFVETDFFNSSSSLRLRHAFAEVGSLLVGQTWSTFMDEDIIVPSLDLEEPRAFIISRRSMVRWTRRSDNVEWAVAIEEPGSEVEAPVGVSGTTEDPMPNVIGRLRWENDRQHVQLSGFVGQARFRADSGAKDDITIWGVNLSGRITLFSRDVLRAQFGYGPGISSFRGGSAAAPNLDNELEALDNLSVTVSYQHYWRDDLWSHLVYSVGEADDDVVRADDDIQEIEYAALNLVWDFAEGMSVGGEWLYGTRTDYDDAYGEANRLLFVFRMDFF